MGVDTKIRLPLGTHSDDILDVVARVLGGNLRPNASQNTDDFSLPASEHNPWYYLRTDEKLKLELSGPTNINGLFGTMHFHAFNKVNFSWYLHMESENEDQVILSPSSTPLAVAMGRRLVEFFGGGVEYSDSTGKINFRVAKEKSMFHKARETSASRLIALTNALESIRPLHSSELFKAIKWASYGDQERTSLVLEGCRELERQAFLEQHLPAAEETTKAPRF